MTSISATAASPSDFSQGEGRPSLHQSVEELVNWFSSELHTFLGTNNVRAPIVVPTQGGNSNGPEPAHVNDHRDPPEWITTLATTTIPFSGSAVQTMVILSLVPSHLEIGLVRPPWTHRHHRPWTRAANLVRSLHHPHQGCPTFRWVILRLRVVSQSLPKTQFHGWVYAMTINPLKTAVPLKERHRTVPPQLSAPHPESW
ncbi:hypothetical protein BJY52DRAFT_1271351 [Lactarius psammicola]|nr:hypothetical protein BJY52DRAFT_1271351 [Lactarius psammicola]